MRRRRWRRSRSRGSRRTILRREVEGGEEYEEGEKEEEEEKEKYEEEEEVLN